MNPLIQEVFFPSGPYSRRNSSSYNRYARTIPSDWILLALRLIFGTLLLVHGVQKIIGYDTLCTTFPDPIGLGSRLSLQLAIFAEFFCSLGVISGLLFRLALVPMIVTMSVAAFITLKGAGWGQQELPVGYLLVFVLLIISGPGKFSIDRIIARKK